MIKKHSIYFYAYIFIAIGYVLWSIIISSYAFQKNSPFRKFFTGYFGGSNTNSFSSVTVTPTGNDNSPVSQKVSQASKSGAVEPTKIPNLFKKIILPTQKPSSQANNTVMLSGFPKKLSIPRIGVEANVEYVGLDRNGAMDVPKQFTDVAWYRLGFRVGDNGSAVITGHYDTTTGAPAVFWRIGELVVNDKINIIDTKGISYTFVVVEKDVYPYDQLPLQRIFGSTGTPGLNLVTCSGKWNKTTKNYSTRTVIYAKKS